MSLPTLGYQIWSLRSQGPADLDFSLAGVVPRFRIPSVEINPQRAPPKAKIFLFGIDSAHRTFTFFGGHSRALGGVSTPPLKGFGYRPLSLAAT